MIKNNLGTGIISETIADNKKKNARKHSSGTVEKNNFIIVNVRGPEGFGKVGFRGKGSHLSGAYYYYDLVSLDTGRVYEKVLAGDPIEVIESKCGVTKKGFIGKMCSVIFNNSSSISKGKAMLKPFNESGLKRSKLGRIKHRMFETVKPTMYGMKSDDESAIAELQAIYSKDREK